MATLLHIQSSIFGDNGQSTGLSNQFVNGWQAQHPDGTVVVRDLAADPLPHLDSVAVGGFMGAPEGRTPEQTAAVALSDDLIAEIQAADVVVIGLPMYNFGIPSTLKAWIDHIARAGITFRYTENGPEGLLKGKTAYIFAARGGIYGGTGNDHQMPYMTQILGFLGITDVNVVTAEGLAKPDLKDDALARAQDQVAALNAGEAQAA